jgi:hypothetical protein
VRCFTMSISSAAVFLLSKPRCSVMGRSITGAADAWPGARAWKGCGVTCHAG